MPRKLTSHEREALEAYWNLADGHARYSWSIFDYALIALLKGSRAVARLSTEEQRFRDAFYAVIPDLLPVGAQPPPLCVPTASLSLEIVANKLRVERATLFAPSPCFDNVIDIFRRHAVPVRPWDDTLENLAVDRRERPAYRLIVAPGNPEGGPIALHDLQIEVDRCRALGLGVILDLSFRGLAPLLSDECGGLLDLSGVEFALVEDTGKIFASHELKCSLLTVSPSSEVVVRDIFEDMMIGHSPLVLSALATALVTDGTERLSWARQQVEVNRSLLRSMASASLYVPDGVASVAWCRATGTASTEGIVDDLRSRGVHVLPGGPFHWCAGEPRRRGHLRVALLRDATYFEGAVKAAFGTTK